MNQKIKYGLIFASGVAAGAAVAYFIMRNKRPASNTMIYPVYNPNEPQEIENDGIPEEERQELANAAKNKPNIMDYASVYKPNPYNYRDEPELKETVEYPDTEVEMEPEEEPEEPHYLYEITLSEFSNYTNDRTRITLFWYEDDVFTDEVNQKVDPREYLDGYLKLLDDNTPIDPIDYVRKMAKDEICIRNFEKNLDIDICSQGITYADYMSVD